MEENKGRILEKIDNPDDLKRLKLNELPQVCSELREFIIDQLSVNPGHFGASLGVVELTIALHYVYNTPYDKLIWDVGHQAYGHKIITGRRDVFNSGVPCACYLSRTDSLEPDVQSGNIDPEIADVAAAGE